MKPKLKRPPLFVLLVTSMYMLFAARDTYLGFRDLHVDSLVLGPLVLLLCIGIWFQFRGGGLGLIVISVVESLNRASATVLRTFEWRFVAELFIHAFTAYILYLWVRYPSYRMAHSVAHGPPGRTVTDERSAQGKG